jgi:hypothetical protein
VNLDVPTIDVTFLDDPDPFINPLGAKGVGEIGITRVASAISDAVWHATGKRLRSTPILAEEQIDSATAAASSEDLAAIVPFGVTISSNISINLIGLNAFISITSRKFWTGAVPGVSLIDLAIPTNKQRFERAMVGLFVIVAL